MDLKNLEKSGWKKYRFEQIASNISERVEPGETDLEIYVGLEHLDSNSIHIKRWGKPSDVEGTKLKVYPGDLIFGKRRAYQRKAAIATFEGICSAHAMVLRANPAVINPQLFPFFIHSDAFMHRAVDISVGSLSPTINWSTLRVQEFLLPPKDQQARLAELLWAGDAVVEGYGELAEKLDNALQSAYRKYLDTTEKGQKKLGVVAEVIMGQSPDGSTYNQEGVGLPLLNGPTEFTDRYPVKVQWTSKPTKVCQKEDILLCVRGSTTGRINISNDIYCIGRGIAAIRGGKGYSTLFLEHVLKHFVGEILRLAAGSTFPNIDSKSLKSILIPDYPSHEQESIATKFDLLLTHIREIKEHEARSRDVLSQLLNQIFAP